MGRLEGFSWVGIGLVSLEGLVEIRHCYREGEHLKIYRGMVIYDDGTCLSPLTMIFSVHKISPLWKRTNFTLQF